MNHFKILAERGQLENVVNTFALKVHNANRRYQLNAECQGPANTWQQNLSNWKRYGCLHLEVTMALLLYPLVMESPLYFSFFSASITPMTQPPTQGVLVIAPLVALVQEQLNVVQKLKCGIRACVLRPFSQTPYQERRKILKGHFPLSTLFQFETL